MKEYIGKEVRAFKFEKGPGMTNDMIKRIGQIGVINSVSIDNFIILFPNGQTWAYPNNQLIENLVEPEPEVTLNEVLEQIKNLKP